MTLALPLLDAMVPARQRSGPDGGGSPNDASSASSSRTAWRRGYWEPATTGALPEKLPFILESLEKVKDQTVVLSGLWSKSAEPPEGTTGSDHWVAAAFLTGSSRGRRRARTRPSAARRSIRSSRRRLAATRCCRRCSSRSRIRIELEQLRRRLQLLVHQLDLVDRPADAAG